MKAVYFDYFITSMILEDNGIRDYTSISFNEFKELFNKYEVNLLKMRNLLFLACASNSNFKIFNNFFVVPYGIMEQDVIDDLENMRNYERINNSTFIMPHDAWQGYEDLDEDVKYEIRESVKSLRNKNEELMDYSAYEVTETVNKCVCYRICMNNGKRKGVYKSKLDPYLVTITEKNYEIRRGY